MSFHCANCGVDYFPEVWGSSLCPVCHKGPSGGGAADTEIERMRRDWADAERRLNEKYIDVLMERDALKAKLAEVEEMLRQGLKK